MNHGSYRGLVHDLCYGPTPASGCLIHGVGRAARRAPWSGSQYGTGGDLSVFVGWWVMRLKGWCFLTRYLAILPSCFLCSLLSLKLPPPQAFTASQSKYHGSLDLTLSHPFPGDRVRNWTELEMDACCSWREDHKFGL